MGPGLELLPLSSTPATPRSPKPRTAEPAVLGMQNGLATTHDAALAPHSEWGGALRAESLGQLTGPVTLGRPEVACGWLTVTLDEMGVKMPT